MADVMKTAGASSGAGNKSGGNASGATGKRTRKDYGHELTVEENYALQTVQRATGALRTINDAIRSGKPVKAEVVRLCHQLNQAAGEMLFAT